MEQTPLTEPAAAAHPISASRKLLAWVVLIAALVGTAAFKYDERTRPALLTGPMVQLPASDRIVIQWTANAPFEQATVRVRAAGESIADVHKVRPQDGRYLLELDHLPPDTMYQYTIQIRGLWSRTALTSGPHMFRTPPSRRANIRFLAFGDSGVGSNTQALLAERMRTCDPDFIIHTGDLIYPTGAGDDYVDNFYRPYQRLLPTSFFLPCLGNHDVVTEQGQPLLDEFSLPPNGPEGVQVERNYYFDYGPARFVALDTNLKEPDGAIPLETMQTAVADWLRDVLTNCDAKWKFVYFHHPFYTNSAHAAEGSAHLKKAFVEILESCKVDIVFNGHNHLYERTAPLYQDEIVDESQIGLTNLRLSGSALRMRDPTDDQKRRSLLSRGMPIESRPTKTREIERGDESPGPSTVSYADADGQHGVIYIVTGAGGAHRYPANPDPPAYIRTYNDAVFSFTDIELRPNVCWVRQIDTTGKAIDRFVIRKGPDPARGSD